MQTLSYFFTMHIFMPWFSALGTIMVPTGGIVLAQPGPIGDKTVSTVPDHQRLGKAVLNVAKGPDVPQTGLRIPPQVMVSSALTPQMNILNISNATPQPSQKSVTTKNQDIQTESETSLQDPLMTAQSSRSLAVEYSMKTASAPVHDFRFKSPDQSRQSNDEKTNSSQILEKGACANTPAAERHYHRPAVSDYEVYLVYNNDSIHHLAGPYTS